MSKDVAGIFIKTVTEIFVVLCLCNLQSLTVIRSPVKRDAAQLDAFVCTY
jgi:hypothetical protein